MKSAIIVLALCGYAAASVIQYAVPHVGVLTSGASSQFRSQDNAGNYAFGYNEDHSTGGTFRREQGGPGVQVGSYGLRDADGRTRVVNYVADAGGFRANIQTNEPGVEPKDPASVSINKPEVAIAPVVESYVAPAAVAAPLAYDAPLAATSYSVSTQHVAPKYVSYAAPLAAPLVAPLAAPLVAPLAAPLVAPLASYATKTIAAPLAQSYLHGW